MKYLFIVFLLFSCSTSDIKSPSPRAPSMDREQQCSMESRITCIMGDEPDGTLTQCERDAFIHCMGSR